VKCFVKECLQDGFWEYRHIAFKGKLACESHKLDGDIDVRNGQEYVEDRKNAFKIKRPARFKRLTTRKK